jgi:hypothetical protein
MKGIPRLSAVVRANNAVEPGVRDENLSRIHKGRIDPEGIPKE